VFRIKPALALFSLLSLTVLSDCQNGGSELPNEISGVLVIGNKPAIAADVELYPVNYVPGDTGNQKLRASTKTDRQGRYSFKEIPPGEYNVLGAKDELGMFRDSVSVLGSEDLGTDTLKSLGSLSGTIQLQPQDNPRSSIVQLLGTNKFVNVDAEGGFELSGLATGSYQLRVSISLDNYAPLFAAVAVRAGIHDTLPDPLIPFYSGIPYVPSISASLDTLQGIARVAWKKVSYRAFQSYIVYRDIAGTLSPSRIPLNTSRITDTVYFDTLYPPRTRVDWDTSVRHWEYRVVAQATSGKSGDPFEIAELDAVPPTAVMTAINLRLLGRHGDSAGVDDTIRIVAKYANPSYGGQRLAWISGASDTLRSKNLTGKSGEDTLVWSGPGSEGKRVIHIEILDAAGRRWTDSLQVTFIVSSPIAFAGADTVAPGGASFSLHGKGTVNFGKIVKWEWDIGASRVFTTTASGDTTFTLPKGERRDYPCVLRVTSDHGLTAMDTVHLEIQHAWITQKSGTKESLNSVHFPDPKNGWAVGNTGIVVHTADGGGTWSMQTTGTVQNLYSVFFFDAKIGWAVGAGVIIRTTDGGVSWSMDESSTPADLHSVIFVDTENGWAVGETCCSDVPYLLHTTDGGVSWIRQSFPGDQKVGLSAVAFLNPGKGWIVGGGTVAGVLLQTTDSGKTWSRGTVGVQSLNYIQFVTDKTGWTGDGNGRLYKTVDGGENWSSSGTLPMDYPQSIFFSDSTSGWIVGSGMSNGRILRTVDGGATWSEQKFGGFGRNLSSAFFLNGVAGWAVGMDGTILKSDLSPE
jgi:photosystem II stability/assembly factor-like uncharacterized protein